MDNIQHITKNYLATENEILAGDVAKAVECLLCKREALSFNPSPPTSKKKKY
jgi:hypothetical protein